MHPIEGYVASAKRVGPGHDSYSSNDQYVVVPGGSGVQDAFKRIPAGTSFTSTMVVLVPASTPSGASLAPHVLPIW